MPAFVRLPSLRSSMTFLPSLPCLYSRTRHDNNSCEGVFSLVLRVKSVPMIVLAKEVKGAIYRRKGHVDAALT
jgi:hypothetical protein